MRYAVVISLFVLVGCSPGVERFEKPANLIPHERMVDLLSEMMKLEGLVAEKYIHLPKYYKVITISGDSLLKAEGYTSKQYEASMDYYAGEQGELLQIYDEVLERLNAEAVELERKQQAN